MVATISTTIGSSAHFEYMVLDEETNHMRAGVVMSVWDGTSATYTDTSTPDLNGPTNQVSFNVVVSGSNVQLTANVTSGTWTIKVGTRIIF